MNGPDWFWVMIIACSGMWAFVAIVKTIVDGVVRVRQQKFEVEREYLAQMMSEIAEIKERLEAPAGTRSEHEERTHV